MDPKTYQVESELEQTHWWFVVRRQLFADFIQKLGLNKSADILDVGTSSGTNLRLLKGLGFTNYRGVDISPLAAQIATRKKLGPVDIGDICELPYKNDTFDLILATDIIEHVDDDERALQELKRVLKPTGQILLTVPAFPSLWGLQDIVSHHKRRYKKRELCQKIIQAGLCHNQLFYFNYLLFIPIWIMRKLISILNIKVCAAPLKLDR